MVTALVTGAAGFIGSHLVEELLNRGYDVRGLDDLSTGTRDNLSSVMEYEAFTFIEGDVRNPETIFHAVDGVEHVFHQAARVSVQQSFEEPGELADVNCTGTSLLFEAARDSGVESVVVASSAAVYGSDGELPKHEDMPIAPESPYAVSKYYTEQAALQLGERYGINAVALRYFNVFGPRQDPEGEYAAVIPAFIDLMLDGSQPVIYGDGEQSRDFVYVDDVVKANVLAAERDCPDGVYNVARGDRLTINSLVALLNSVLEEDIDPQYDEPRLGEVRHSEADVSKAHYELGFEPAVGLEEGLQRTADALDEQ